MTVGTATFCRRILKNPSDLMLGGNFVQWQEPPQFSSRRHWETCDVMLVRERRRAADDCVVHDLEGSRRWRWR